MRAGNSLCNVEQVKNINKKQNKIEANLKDTNFNLLMLFRLK